MDFSNINFTSALSTTIFIISSTFAAIIAWFKFKQDYWIKRNITLYESFLSYENPSEKEAILNVLEEERFRIIFKRPSTPQFRSAVWNEYLAGSFTISQFRLCSQYADLNSDDNSIFFVSGRSTINFILNALAFSIVAIGTLSFTYQLITASTPHSYLSLIFILSFLIPPMIFFIKEMLGILTANDIERKIKNRKCAHDKKLDEHEIVND